MKKMIYKYIRVDSPKYTQDYSKLIVPTMHPPLETTHSPPPQPQPQWSTLPVELPQGVSLTVNHKGQSKITSG